MSVRNIRVLAFLLVTYSVSPSFCTVMLFFSMVLRPTFQIHQVRVPVETSFICDPISPSVYAWMMRGQSLKSMHNLSVSLPNKSQSF